MRRYVTAENKKWWTLGAVSVGLFVIMLDNTVVNVALPSMRRSLHMSLSELEWVVAGYALTFAAFMLTGGKLADYVGRRLIFMLGLVVFTGASLACGLAPNGGFLIGARVVQGLGAFAVAAAALIAFVLLERHQRIPMLDLSLFRNRTFGGANASMLFVGLAMFGTFFYVSLYMQQVLGYSPVQTGASFLPLTLLIIVIAPRAGALTDKVGSRWLV